MKCRICAQATSRSYVLHSRRHALDVRMFRCPACDAFLSEGSPVDYADLDIAWYYLAQQDYIRERYMKIFAFIERQVPVGRFLDIGAGIGFSLDVAFKRGWVAAGLEPNRSLAAHAQSRGLNVANAYLSEATAGEYDALLIDNVLEHIHDPAAFLRQARRLMSPSGVAVIVVPPLDWVRRSLGALAWVRDRVNHPQLNVFAEVDQHVNLFSRKAMGRLSQAVGLKLMDVRFHHSPVFDNRLVRALAIDDGYYVATRS